MKKYWQITNDMQLTYKELFKEIKDNLSVWEAKLIWYLRNSRCGTAQLFFRVAKKLYEADIALAELSEPVTDLKSY